MAGRLWRAAVAATLLGSGVLAVGWMPASATTPEVCAYASVGHNGSTTTIAVDQGCPGLPPDDPDDPCPGGIEAHEGSTQAGISHYEMVCVKGL